MLREGLGTTGDSFGLEGDTVSPKFRVQRQCPVLQFQAQLSAGCREAMAGLEMFSFFHTFTPSLGDFRAGGDVELHLLLPQLLFTHSRGAGGVWTHTKMAFLVPQRAVTAPVKTLGRTWHARARLHMEMAVGNGWGGFLQSRLHP